MRKQEAEDGKSKDISEPIFQILACCPAGGFGFGVRAE